MAWMPPVGPMGFVVLVLVAGVAFGIVGVDNGVVTTAPQQTGVSGDCRRASTTDFSTLFLFTTSDGVPLPGISVSASGITQVTNSSGFAVIFGGGNFTIFSVAYQNTELQGSLAGRQLPVVCEGSTYYRVAALEITSAAGSSITRAARPTVRFS